MVLVSDVSWAPSILKAVGSFRPATGSETPCLFQLTVPTNLFLRFQPPVYLSGIWHFTIDRVLSLFLMNMSQNEYRNMWKHPIFQVESEASREPLIQDYPACKGHRSLVFLSHGLV